MNKAIAFPLAACLALAATALTAQPSGDMPQGTLERVKVHGASLEGNLSGDDPDREAIVYLPPGYAADDARRYPVVYFLPGYAQTAESMARFLDFQATADSAIANNGAREVIVVIPDPDTRFNGSMYSNSPTIGDWESFIARDLVAYMDEHYRTIADRDSRGLSGHSMGGYGTVRIAMKTADVFAAFYAMSSCCLMNRAPSLEAVEAELARGDAPAENMFGNVQRALAAAWAPNPNNPPQYFDWPYEDGEAVPLVQAKWVANSPLVMVDQYVPNLQRYEAIMLDVGDADGLSADNRRLSEALTRLGVEHKFELYEGNHISGVKARFATELLPFFSHVLEFE